MQTELPIFFFLSLLQRPSFTAARPERRAPSRTWRVWRFFVVTAQVPLAALAPNCPLEHWLPLGSHAPSHGSSSSSSSGREVHPWLLHVRCAVTIAQVAKDAAS